MKHFDVVIVGAGPAGTSAAHILKKAGCDCLLLDKKEFPRVKLCAGWVTPDVWEELEVAPQDYPHGLLRFDAANPIAAHLGWYTHNITSIQYSIRRYEFDNWLLERSDVFCEHRTVKKVVRVADGFVIDDDLKCTWIIGAGGTTDPVAREFFPPTHFSERGKAVTREEEFPYEWTDSRCHLYFFQGGAPVYGWCVPKENRGMRHVNVGIGGTLRGLKSRGETIHQHWDILVQRLHNDGLVVDHAYDPHGHYYYAQGKRMPHRPAQEGRAYICGDAAGLATNDLFEGVGNAIRSGIRAAQAITHDTSYTIDDLPALTISNPLMARGLAWKFCS